MPDVVANLRVDQAWGGAQIMGAIHHVGTGYYGAGTENLGHPSDSYGYALGAGLKLNAPMIGAGDYLQLQANYTEGAMRYASFTANASYSPALVNGQSLSWGWSSDGVYGAIGTAVQLTTAWTVDAAYEHFWNRQWRTSLYGGYLGTSYNAGANQIICASQIGAVVAARVGCNENWNQWWIGSRTQWNVTPDTYLGLDVFYQRLQTATVGLNNPIIASPGGGTTPNGLYNVGDQGQLSFRFRAHKDFYP